MAKYIGKEMSRVDGFAKVTGQAKYASEYKIPNVAYGYIAQSEIAKGSIRSIETSEAEKQSGVLKILTHLNCPKTKSKDEAFAALQSDKIVFSGQPIALVIAETFEQARFAARLVKTEYLKAEHVTEAEKAPTVEAPAGFFGKPKPRGDAKTAFEKAEVKVEAEYTIPIEHHNAMEPHAAIAMWDGGKLMVFDKSQGVGTVQGHLAESFGIPKENVSVSSEFVGGAFGSALNPNYYSFIAACAAREVNRPVKLNYTRRQTFTGNGYRPYTWQKVSIGASRDGKLQSIIHEAVGNTSSFENFGENPNGFGRTLYNCENYDTPYSLAKTDLPTPTWMRAPGAVSGAFALESALDELAYELNIDPLELRIINYAEKDPETGKPFSSKALMECFRTGAKKFGWEKRKMEPRSMRDGRWLVGWGTATGLWGAYQAPATMKMTVRKDGSVYIGSATADIGPGTYTVITMIAAEYLGIEPDKIKFELGDTKLPNAPMQGGSLTVASVGTAAHGAAGQIKQKLLEIVLKMKNSPMADAKIDDVELADGVLRTKKDKGNSLTIGQILQEGGLDEVSVTHTSMPGKERGQYTTQAHGAQFVEVKVDEELGIIKVTRVMEATACGRIMNPKTSHSQEMGGVVGGIGMALTEITEIDHRYGRMTTTDLASYHVPSHADIHEIETEFVEEIDTVVNPLGVKGMGELCLVGIPAAIANAVFHATGKRFRDLPITPDKLI